MKRKLLVCTTTLLTTACLLAACGNQPDTVPESQAIVSPTQELAEGAQDTAITATQESTAQTPPPQTGETVSISPQAQNSSNAFISETDAKKAAFDHAGVQEADVKGLRVKLDYDDGRQSYEVDFYANGSEYEYEINATDGSILSYDSELSDHRSTSSAQASSNTAGISEEEAINLALEQVPGAVKTDITRYVLDQDDGRSLYEIEILYSNMEYDIEIDAQTGEILKLSQEQWND